MQVQVQSYNNINGVDVDLKSNNKWKGEKIV